MFFEVTDEQRLIRNSVERLVEDHYSLQNRVAYGGEPDGWSRDVWQRFSQLGVLGLTVPTHHGGFGGGALDLAVVMEALGRAMVLEPFFATVALGVQALKVAGSEEQQAEWFPRVMAGSTTIAFAHSEPRIEESGSATRAATVEDGWRLSGKKVLVLNGAGADFAIVSAQAEGEKNRGASLFLVPLDAQGLSVDAYRLQDGTPAADIMFDGVVLPASSIIGRPGEADDVIEAVLHAGIAAMAAEAVGVMQQLLDSTVEYLRMRKQFGVPLASFQVLQHRCVDMLVALEESRSMALLAAHSVDHEPLSEQAKNVFAARIHVGRSLDFVGRNAIQLHGGIGMALEHTVGNLFLRSCVLRTLFGTTDEYLERLAKLGGLVQVEKPTNAISQ